MSYTRKMRDLAKSQKKPLFTIAYDCRHIGGSEIMYQGVGDDDLVQEIRALILRATDRENQRRST